MMHPDELLAGYVDGALAEAERSEVERHLSSCPTCRLEVELAAAARTQLRTLADLPVPVGVTGPVLREALGHGERTARIYRWVGAAAVAAAVVAVLAVALPDLGGGGDTAGGGAGARTAEAGAEQAPAAPAPRTVPTLEQSSRDFQLGDLQGLAEESKRLALDAAVGIPSDEAVARASDALACVLRGSDLTPEDEVVRLIDARFEGTPAYLAAALRGPGAGQPPSKLVIWVVAKDGCVPLSFSQGKL